MIAQIPSSVAKEAYEKWGAKVKFSGSVNLRHRYKRYHSQGVKGMLSENVNVFVILFEFWSPKDVLSNF